MKFLLCDFETNNTPELEDHYLNFHNVDRENRFLKDYLKTKTMFFMEDDALGLTSFYQQLSLKLIMIF